MEGNNIRMCQPACNRYSQIRELHVCASSKQNVLHYPTTIQFPQNTFSSLDTMKLPPTYLCAFNVLTMSLQLGNSFIAFLAFPALRSSASLLIMDSHASYSTRIFLSSLSSGSSPGRNPRVGCTSKLSGIRAYFQKAEGVQRVEAAHNPLVLSCVQ